MLKKAVIVSSVLWLGACQAPTQDAEPVVKPYSVQAIKVSVAEGSAKGRFEDAALRSSFVAQLSAELEEDAETVGGGPQAAIAEVVFTELKLKTSGSRSFGGVNSVWGRVTIKDQSGNVLRGPEMVQYFDQAKNNTSTINGIPVGLLVNLGRNSSDQESGKDLEKLMEGFSTSFTNWLLE
ncbi:hypothetical protein [Pseudophaeobacter sp.]|uniref:hypothetical protein n=1 Tax=Pseudophaeobacter sp. TaxID=1971739 RepID=UPI003299C16C